MVQKSGLAEITWWPVDWLILGYFATASLVIVLSWQRVPQGPWLLALHGAGAAMVVLAVKRPAPWTAAFRQWYPLPYVAACYKEMALLIPPLRGEAMDTQLAALDYAIWGVHPTVWLERIQSPALTESIQWLYALFIPAVLLPAFLLWRKRRILEFRQYSFLIALGFLVSYAGYLLVPARGPRFVLAHLQHAPLAGLWLCDALRAGLDRLESAHYDCFPSGHTALTLLAWRGTRSLSKVLNRGYLVYTLAIVFATVYLRYHYTVDVMAGAALAAGLMVAAPHLYRWLEGTCICEAPKSFRLQAGKREGSS